MAYVGYLTHEARQALLAMAVVEYSVPEDLTDREKEDLKASILKEFEGCPGMNYHDRLRTAGAAHNLRYDPYSNPLRPEFFHKKK